MAEVKYTQISGKDSQVGGDHYLYAIQPAEFIAQNKLGFLEGNAIKYLVRHHRKGGLEDLKKAIHYIQLLAESSYSTQVHTIFLEGEEAKTKVKIGVLREVEAPAKYTAYVESDPLPEPRDMLGYLCEVADILLSEISETIGADPLSISQWVDGHGSIPEKYHRAITELYLAKKSLVQKDLAEKVLGVKPIKKSRTSLPKPWDMLRYLKYDKSLSNQRIASKLGCSYQTVSRWLHHRFPEKPSKGILKRLTQLYLDQQS